MLKLKIQSVCSLIIHHRVFLLLKNNFFLVAFGVVLGSLSIINLWYIIPLVGYLLILCRKNRMIGCITFIITAGWMLLYGGLLRLPILGGDIYSGIIIESEEKSTYQKLLIECGYKKLLIYSTAEEHFRVGDEIEVYGEFEESGPPHIPGGFNYTQYLKYQHIIGIIKTDNITKIRRPLSIWLMKDGLETYLSTCFSEEACSYLTGLLFGDRSGFSEEFEISLSMNGLVHLFAVSGLHVGLIIGLIHTLFTKFHWRNENRFLVIFLFCYCVVTAFSPSILRATAMFYFALANRKWKLGLSSMDIISILFIVFVYCNPYYIHHAGFCLSFLVATMIIILSPLLKKASSVAKIMVISLGSQILTLPLIITMNHEMNVICFLGNVVFIVLVSSIVMPASLITLVFCPIQSLFVAMMKAFEWMSSLMSFVFIPYQAPTFPPIAVIFYYILVYCGVYHYKNRKKRSVYLLLLAIFLLVGTLSGHFEKEGRVVFIDCYEGEAILISSPHKKTNILIDTGIGKNHEVTNFLLSEGINNLDILFITHDHDDHFGEFDYMRRHIRIQKLITSSYSSLFPNAIHVRAGDQIQCREYTFDVLSPNKNALDLNDESLVLYTIIHNKAFLFMGDASIAIEEALPSLPVDILKVGHHGSNTATSSSFLVRIKPTYAIIQTGQTSKYQFPTAEVLKRLNKENIITYSTSIYYTITYWYQGVKDGFRFQNYPLF
ncbi:MAG: DNA internalization-related competence protein ComEC/Rec2 [Bacilli bacterium]|nr:DNA internalization-related competence protein ComEC/Rec2 [Bacilli bacterium]